MVTIFGKPLHPGQTKARNPVVDVFEVSDCFQSTVRELQDVKQLSAMPGDCQAHISHHSEETLTLVVRTHKSLIYSHIWKGYFSLLPFRGIWNLD